MAAERKLFIGHKLRRLRREEGVTQAQMAQAQQMMSGTPESLNPGLESVHPKP